MPDQDFDPVENLVAATDGPPGQRRFFLQAAGRGNLLTLGCEKVQVRDLLDQLKAALEAHNRAAGPEPRAARPPVEPLGSELVVVQLGVGYHEQRELFVIVARALAAGAEGSDPQELSTFRLWLGAHTVRAFARQAEEKLAAGRPICPRCGLPMDADGHPCPVSNGSRPIF